VLSSLSSDIDLHSNNICSLFIGFDSNQSEKSTRRRTNAMNSFLTKFCLETILVDDTPTFHHNNQTAETRIDHMYHNFSKNSPIKLSLSENLCPKENPSNLSSNDVIIGKIQLPSIPSTKSEKDYTSTYTPFLVKKPKWCEDGMSGYQAQAFRILSDILPRFDEPEHIPTLTEMCSNMLVMAAERNFETTNPSNEVKKKNFLYFSKEHRDAFTEHETICKKWRNEGRPQEKSQPAKANKMASQRILQKIRCKSEAAVRGHSYIA
jgi:hypothetical protein